MPGIESYVEHLSDPRLRGLGAVISIDWSQAALGYRDIVSCEWYPRRILG